MKIRYFNNFFLAYSNLPPLSTKKEPENGQTLKQNFLRTLSRNNLHFSGLIRNLKDKSDGKKLRYH